MKARLFAMAAAALLSAGCFTSCTNEDVLPEAAQTVEATWPKVIKVNFETPSSRLVMGSDGFTPMWQEYYMDKYSIEHGDFLTVYSFDANGRQLRGYYNCVNPAANEFEFDEGHKWVWADDTNVKASTTPVGPYIIIYAGNYIPAVEPENGTFRVHPLMNKMTVKANDLDYTFMVGTSNDLKQTVTMKNILALIKFTVPKDQTITQVNLVADCATYATYDCATGTYSNQGRYPKAESNIIQMGNVWYNPVYNEDENSVEPLEPGTHYIPMVPQEIKFTAKTPLQLLFSSSVLSSADKNAQPLFSSIQTEKDGKLKLEAGKIYDFGEIAFPIIRPDDPDQPTDPGTAGFITSDYEDGGSINFTDVLINGPITFN